MRLARRPAGLTVHVAGGTVLWYRGDVLAALGFSARQGEDTTSPDLPPGWTLGEYLSYFVTPSAVLRSPPAALRQYRAVPPDVLAQYWTPAP
jgi:hypothetical protein